MENSIRLSSSDCGVLATCGVCPRVRHGTDRMNTFTVYACDAVGTDLTLSTTVNTNHPTSNKKEFQMFTQSTLGVRLNTNK